MRKERRGAYSIQMTGIRVYDDLKKHSHPLK